MINIDWSYAPPGAEHFHKGDIIYVPHWRKRGFYCDLGLEAFGWIKDTYPSPVSECIERPQPKPWSGPEDGLPPVGTVCEIRQIWNPGNWSRREVFYISYHNLITGIDGLEWHDDTRAVEFRQVRTPEQIATEEREMAREIGVAQMMEHIYFSLPKELWDECKPACYALYDAGFKREVV